MPFISNSRCHLTALLVILGVISSPGACLAQDPPGSSSSIGGSDSPCNGQATFLMIGIPASTKYEVDLRQGRPPGSTKLRSAAFDGDSQVTFAGLCAGEYFFAYRKKGEADYSVSTVMQSKVDKGQVSRIGSRVLQYTTMPGLVSGSKKTKASGL